MSTLLCRAANGVIALIQLIHVIHGRAIGSAPEMRVGSVATLVGITQEMALYDVVFLFNNEQEVVALLEGPVGDKVRAKFEEKVLIGLVYWANGFRNLSNSKRSPNWKTEMAAICA